MPPLPFWPVKFSGLIDRDLAFDNCGRVPRFIPNPSKAFPKTAADAQPIITVTAKTFRFFILISPESTDISQTKK
jgi:hypothetical protein